jgi:hypothetical protein
MHDPYSLLARRFAAFCIDATVVFVLLRVVGAAVASSATRGQALSGGVLFAEWIVVTTIGVGYWVVLVGRWNGTVGQHLLRVRVRSGGRPIGYRRQLLRCAIAPVAFAPVGLGYMWAILDRDYRSWVDRLSGSEFVTTVSHAPLVAPSDVEAEPIPVADVIDVGRLQSVADALEQRGHLRAAAVCFRTLGTGHRDPQQLARAALLFAESGDSQAAIAIATQLAIAEKSSGLSHAAHALALARANAPTEGTSELHSAKAMNAPSELVRRVEVELASASDAAAYAQTRACEITRDHPESLDAWMLRARVGLDSNDLDDAKVSTDRAIELAPWSVDALWARAQALGPGKAWLHPPPSRAALDALAAVLRFEPQHAPARRQLRLATIGRRGAVLVFAIGLAIWALTVLLMGTGPDGNAANAAYALIPAVPAAALLVWNRIVRTRTVGATREWAIYLDTVARAAAQRRGGRAVTPASVFECAPPDSALRNPARCNCSTLQRLSGSPAVQYVRMHLVSLGASPAPGVYQFKCPNTTAAYIAVDGNVVDAEPVARLFRVEQAAFETQQTVSTGMYL